MLCVLFLFRVFYNFHAFIMNNFRHRVLRIEPNNAAVQKGAIIVGALNLHLDKK